MPTVQPLPRAAGCAVLTALALTGCVAAPSGAPSLAGTAYVSVSVEEHQYDRDDPPTGTDYAPFLDWQDRELVRIITLGSSTRPCWPVALSSTVDQDGALFVSLGHGEHDPDQECAADAVPQQWFLPVPADTGSEAIIRLQWTGQDTVYEYPMGPTRPAS